MLDTKGPEIRTTKLKDHKEVFLQAGKPFTFFLDPIFVGDENGVGVSYMDLPKSVKPSDRILVSDGLISFTVVECHSDRVLCVVENDGLFHHELPAVCGPS